MSLILRAGVVALLLFTHLPVPALSQRNQCGPGWRRAVYQQRCVKVEQPPPAPVWKLQEREWQVTWVPNLWASALDGQAGVGNNVVDVDMSFSDIFDHLDYAVFLTTEMRKGRWAGVIELLAVKLSGQRAVPRTVFETAELDANQTMIEISPRYRVTPPGRVDVDLIGGIRLWAVSSTLILSDGVALTTGIGDQWVDPIIGSRLIAELGRGFVIQTRGDIGGFGVGSEFTWQLMGLLGYNINRGATLLGGYRYLDVDFEDDDGLLFDVAMKGLILAAAIRL